MRKLFLASSFKDSAGIFKEFAKDKLHGKTVTFIPTASIVEKERSYVDAARESLQKMGLIIDELEVTSATHDEVSNKLRRNDYIYVSGGNTFFLLQELKKKDADTVIIEQIKAGKLFIGESAGAMITSPGIEYVKDMDDYRQAGQMDTYEALNVVDFYPLPHHTNFPFKRTVEKMIAKYQSQLKLFPISNSQAILVDGNDVRVEQTA